MSSGISLFAVNSVARASDDAPIRTEEPHDPAPTEIAPPRATNPAPASSAGDHAAALAAAAKRDLARIDTTLDPRSAAAISTLLPAAQRAARRLLATANDGRLGPGITVKVICGTRTYAEQTALYAHGRTTPGSIVTDAPAGYSNHNFGIAFDVGIFLRGEYEAESPLYAQVGALGRSQGLEWGGDWKGFPDEPHFQLPWEGTLSQARALLAEGKWGPKWA